MYMYTLARYIFEPLKTSIEVADSSDREFAVRNGDQHLRKLLDDVTSDRNPPWNEKISGS